MKIETRNGPLKVINLICMKQDGYPFALFKHDPYSIGKEDYHIELYRNSGVLIKLFILFQFVYSEEERQRPHPESDRFLYMNLVYQKA